MSNKIYLDVDGCINVFNNNSIADPAWDDFDSVRVLSYWITYSKKMMDALLDIDAEIVWATSWSDKANLIADEIGIDHLRYLEFDQFKDRDWNNCGKLPVVMADCGENNVVWIDDCLGVGDINWIKQRNFLDLPTLGIKPDESYGITPDHIESINDFFERNK